MFDLTGPGIEPQTSRADSDVFDPASAGRFRPFVAQIFYQSFIVGSLYCRRFKYFCLILLWY